MNTSLLLSPLFQADFWLKRVTSEFLFPYRSGPLWEMLTFLSFFPIMQELNVRGFVKIELLMAGLILGIFLRTPSIYPYIASRRAQIPLTERQRITLLFIVFLLLYTIVTIAFMTSSLKILGLSAAVISFTLSIYYSTYRLIIKPIELT